jgi:hypothetical protein
MAISTAGSERARIDSSGRLLVGTSAARANFDNSTVSAAFQLEGTTSDTSAAAIVRNSADANPAVLKLAKSRGTTIGSNTVISSGDSVGAIHFQGSDGTQFVEAGRVEVVVDGSPGANDLPGRIVLSTSLDGASAATEKWRVTNDGVFCYNQETPIAKAGAATLTAAELKNGIIVHTNATNTNLTFPTGTDIEASFAGVYTNMTCNVSIVAAGTGSSVLQANTGITITGNASIANAGTFAVRRTAANTYVAYRIS